MRISKPQLPKPQVVLNDIVKRVPSADSWAAIPKQKYDKLNKKSKRRLLRWGLVSGNIALLLGVGIFVIGHRSVSQTIRTSTVNSATTTTSSLQRPLDQLSSAQIALTAAQMTRLPEIKAVRAQADSDSILLAMTPNDTTVLAKPQIVPTVQRSKQAIIRYEAKAGDTITSIANKYGVTADSVSWSNSLSGSSLTAGTKLVVPPVNGLVYTVKDGDTPASLARQFRADESQIITYNDAELSGLIPGEQIIIPNGSKSAPLTYGVFVPNYGGNGYDFGYCTYYAAARVAVPNNWGNANTWDNYAAVSGWTVSKVPRAGAIGQTNAGWLGHVGVVEEVSDDGTMIKYSDMNGLAGWGRVGYSDWAPVTRFQNYLYQ
ncbi:LysM peptidoglycan-binding domain-containing protein [Candidatus Saccharibacteria bacterium]|nr:LysM peptidoglycan-binding domain-containing protein [Candidatus Saccharibacteria bacterium]